MNAKKRVLIFSSALALVFSSCKKDVIIKEEDSISAVVSNNLTANEVVETTPPVWKSVVYNVNSNVAGFWQGVPARYSLTTKKYPLIVFIHGIGELGTSLSRMNCCGLPRHLYNKTFPANFNVGGINHSFIVIAPQFKVRPSAAQVQSVIDFAKRRWRVDEARVYVTGLSMGGGSTWDWSAVYGQNAAAIVPVCGGTKPTSTLTSNIATKNLPIWGLYSNTDHVIPVQWGRDFFNWIDAKNTTYAPKTKLTIWYDGVTHNGTWGRAFNPLTKVDGYSIYQWMLLHKRGTSYTAPTTTTTTNKAPIARAGADKTIYLSSTNRTTLDGTTSYDPDGSIVSYNWTKMSGPSYVRYDGVDGKLGISSLLRGTYYFKLTVKDNKGAIANDYVYVYVK
jgi:pimeloyl-ACP methyl ester carboxylesterase